MTYAFDFVRIEEFDVHIALQPLQSRETRAVQRHLLFLLNERNYRAFYTNPKDIQTAMFTIRPLTKDDLEGKQHNHFWSHYKDILTYNGAPDYWKLQMPFVCIPTTRIRLNLAGLGQEWESIQGSVKPKVFLSAQGWSVTLSISLWGRIELTQLVSFVGFLRNRTKNVRPFLIDGQENTLADIHIYLSDLIRREIYSPENPPGDVLNPSRHLVLCVSRIDGPRRLYQRATHDKPEFGEMTPEDRASIHSVLYGRPVSEVEASVQTVSYTQFADTEFALSEFGHGTLLFMQEDPATELDHRNNNTLECLCSNIQSCTRMILTLQGFYDRAVLRNDLSPKAQQLRDAVPYILKQLPAHYTNKVCRTFSFNYSPYKRIVASLQQMEPK